MDRKGNLCTSAALKQTLEFSKGASHAGMRQKNRGGGGSSQCKGTKI